MIFTPDQKKQIYDRGIIHTGNLYRMFRVMKKAMTGEAITIGFIGGSITAGSLSSTPETCYAYRVFTWWQQMFPMSSVRYINAGVGATTSQFGVARVEDDLFYANPDVIFVEFSVNDDTSELYRETYEGLIRRILVFSTEPALFLINNVSYDDGHNAQSIHNEIGMYYDLPIVSMKESLYVEILKGRLPVNFISPDYLHPNDLGHEIVAGVIINLLDQMHHKVIQNDDYGLLYIIPDKPITSNRYITSVQMNNKNSTPKLSGFHTDESVKEGNWDVFKNGWIGWKAGSSIRFEVEAKMISIQYCKYAKHPAPIARVIIDEDETNAAILDANFNETWGDCLYLQDIMIEEKPGKHVIDITILEGVEGKEFYLAAVITV